MDKPNTGWKSVVLASSFTAVVGGVGLADWPHPPENIQEHVIPIGEDSPTVLAVKDQMAAALAGVKRDESGPPKVLATADKGYLLAGNLFETGSCFAIYEPKIEAASDATLALAERTDAGWALRGLWGIPLTWVPNNERWIGIGANHVDRDSLRVPFDLEDLIGDKGPELVVAGEKMKYRQVQYVMHFNARTRGLDLLTYSMVRPAKVGPYLRVYRAAPNKATWSEWVFWEWKEGELAKRAVWHSESPFNNIDPPFDLAWSPGKDGKGDEIRIEQNENLELTKDKVPFAQLAIRWKAEHPPEEWDLIQGAWLFEQITGLPRDLFPASRGREQLEKPKLEKLEDHAEIQIVPGTETPEARLLFSRLPI